MNININGKIALVSGGSRGIGRSISLSLAEEGCNVCIFSRDKHKVDSAVKEIISFGVRGFGICADASEKTTAKFVMDETEKYFGNVDILVNNVGGGGRWGTEEYEKFDEWEEVYEKNAGIASKLTMRCLPFMKKQKWGRVITISSIVGKGSKARPWFGMAKSAEISLMKNLSGKYPGITFNTVAPGSIYVGKDKEYIGGGKAEDVSGIVVFLCSDKAKHINGSCIVVDGGESECF